MPKLNTQYSLLNTKHLFAVILVGGKGKRLRPLSTDALPKAFLSITKDRKTMFRATLDRIRKMIPDRNILVAANKKHLRLVRKEFPGVKKENLILEPVSRNTAGAIGLAAMALKKRSPNAIMIVLPADQYITDEAEYLAIIKKAAGFASGNDCLVLLGLRPTYPATGFGYIKISEKRKAKSEKLKGVYKINTFVEKPDLEAARRYMKSGQYLWNAGAFVFGVNSILKAIREHAPDIYSLLMRAEGADLNKVYSAFPDISIDYAVMERAGNIFCVMGNYRWKDIGSFEVLKEVLTQESRGFVEKNGKIIKIL